MNLSARNDYFRYWTAIKSPPGGGLSILLASFCAGWSRLSLRRGALGRFLRLRSNGGFLFFRSCLFLRLLFCRGFGFFSRFLLRSGLLALCFGRCLFDLRLVADELEDCHLGGVTATRAELDD